MPTAIWKIVVFSKGSKGAVPHIIGNLFNMLQFF